MPGGGRISGCGRILGKKFRGHVQNMSDSTRKKWEERYAAEGYLYGVEPVPFLREKVGLLPRGRALCLAAGEGRNAVYLAQQGYEVTAIDIAAGAVEKCRALARSRGVDLNAVQADLLDCDLGTGVYDLVTNFFFCERALFAPAMAALKPGGLFVLQTFSRDQAGRDCGPSNPAFLLAPNELWNYFKAYRIRYYEDAVVAMREEGEEREGAMVRMIVEKQSVD